METPQEFRRQCENARKLADQSADPADREFWLALAEDWAKLAHAAAREPDPPDLKLGLAR